MTSTIDPDSDTARLAAHRRLHNIGLPPHPDVEAAKHLRQEAAMLVSQAVGEVDSIVTANPVGYSDFGRNPRRNHNDKHAFTLREAKQRASYAAKLLREAWEMLDPSMSRPPQIRDDHALRTRLVELGWRPPAKAVDQPQCPTVAWQHPARSDLVTSDPNAYTGLSTGKPRELVLKNDVVDHIDWLEHGIDEWRAYAVEAGKQLKAARDQREMLLIALDDAIASAPSDSPIKWVLRARSAVAAIKGFMA